MTKKLLFLLAAALFSLFSYNIIIDSSKEKPSDYVDVDLSWIVPISEDSNSFKFRIPKEFNATYRKGDSYFTFYVKPTSEGLPFEKIGPTNSNHLRVLVKVVDSEKRMRSVYLIKESQCVPIEKKNSPCFVGERGEFDKYEYDYGAKKTTIGTYFHKKDVNGSPIVIDDPGDWSVGFRAYRRLNDNIEIDYVFSKKVGIEQWNTLDKYVVDTIISFQSPYNKALQRTSR